MRPGLTASHYLASLLVLALMVLYAAPATNGLRCRFWLSPPAGPESGPGTHPGLLRQEFSDPRFGTLVAFGEDGTLDRHWDGTSAIFQKSFRWTGLLEIPETGWWSLGTRSDDGSFLAVDGRAVAVNWSDHGPRTRWGRALLEKGYHRLRVDFYNRDGLADIQLWWQPPGGEPAVVPMPYLSHFRDLQTPVPAPEAWERALPLSGERLPILSWADYWGGFDAGALIAAGNSTAPPAKDRPRGTVRVWRGYLEAPATLGFQFNVGSPQVSQLYLDGRRVELGPGISGSGMTARTLALGTHALRLVTAVLDMDPALAVRPLGVPHQLPSDADLWSVASLAAPDLLAAPQTEPPLVQEVHRSLTFDDETTLCAPYIYKWDCKRMGHPAAVPPLEATWTGFIRIPPEADCVLTLRGSGEAQLDLGRFRAHKGLDTPEVKLPIPGTSGSVPLSVSVRDPGVIRKLELLWQVRGRPVEPVPASALQVPDLQDLRGWQHTVAVPLVLLVLAGIGLGGGIRVYLVFLRQRFLAHVWVLVMLVGLSLRLHDYAYVPGMGDADDEFNSHSIGTSLVTGQVPLGWEWHLQYPVSYPVPLYNRTFQLVAPIAIYPPAFAVVVGAVNRAAGAQSPLEARFYVTRLVPIALSMLVLALIWPAGRSLGLSSLACLLATGFVATYPVGIMVSHLVKEENLLSPCYFLLVWLMAPPGSGGGWRTRWAAGTLIVCSILTKQLGVASLLFTVVVLLRRGKLRAAGLAILHGVLGIALFVWFGVSYGGEWFFKLQSELGNYAGRIDALWPLLAENKVTSAEVGSAWLLGLFMALAIHSVRAGVKKRGRVLMLAVVCYLFVMVLAVPGQRNYGWYRQPIVALLALAWGAESEAMLTAYSPLNALLWVGFFVLPGLPMVEQTGAGELLRGLHPSQVLRGATLLLVLPALFLAALSARWRRPLSRILGCCLIAATLVSFAIVTLHWRELHPPVFPPDPVPLGDTRP